MTTQNFFRNLSQMTRLYLISRHVVPRLIGILWESSLHLRPHLDCIWSRLLSRAKRISFINRIVEPVNLRAMAMSTNVSISQSKERETFLDVLPFIQDSLTNSPKFAEVPEVASWIKQVLDYNLAGGKKNRGVTTVFAYEMSEKPKNINEENMRLARVLGWCVEMAYFLVMDDIMDGATTRRGVPCWYRLPHVGLEAINDSILIHQSIYEILAQHFRHLPQYADIVDLFNECILYTSSGQYLDYTMAHHNKNDYSLFTIERYESIVKYKTSYYTFKLPVFLGITLANITDKTVREKANNICLKIGNLFQMQDDFIDCFSEEAVTGKAGTDIQEGKCCWLAVTALQRCNPSQRALFEKHYASSNPEHVQIIKQLYEQLELPKIYREQERAKYNNIITNIEDLSQDSALSPKLFLKLLDMIYNRKH